jgi:hypothetical protein
MIAAAPRSVDPLRILRDRLDSSSDRYAQDREREACAADVRAFVRHVWILHPVDGPMVFKAWAWQLQLLALMMVTRLLVILKARQLGVSWLAAIFALWTAMFRPGQRVLLISKGQDDADDLLGKVSFVFHRLPEWMQPAYRENTSSLRFPDLDSEIESLPATMGVGRSKTASLVILDEHGHQRWARKIYLALKPVVEKGKLFSISTANGQGALHTHLYLAAKRGINGFKAVFVPWSAHPDRDARWRDRERSEMSELDDAEFAQEYPANDVEAFIASGRPVFRDEDLKRLTGTLEAGVTGPPGLTIFRAPAKDKIYLVGADTGEGLATSDWCYASVIERDTGEQVAVLAGRWAPDLYAEKLDKLARHFGQHAVPGNRTPVIVGVERNNHGHAVLLRLAQLAAGGPYTIYRAKDKRPGWLTSTSSRPVLVDQLEEAVRTEATVIHDAGTVDQMQTFAYNDEGKPEAAEGFHDDAVMAHGIAWQLRRRAFGRVLDVPASQRKAAA